MGTVCHTVCDDKGGNCVTQCVTGNFQADQGNQKKNRPSDRIQYRKPSVKFPKINLSPLNSAGPGTNFTRNTRRK